jgi:hypothetical protein
MAVAALHVKAIILRDGNRMAVLIEIVRIIGVGALLIVEAIRKIEALFVWRTLSVR